MRVGYSILREINNKSYELVASDYGLKEFEFDRMIRLLEHQGYIERILRNGEKFSLKPAKLTDKGINFLREHSKYEEDYPLTRDEINAWVQVEKLQYSNGADEE